MNSAERVKALADQMDDEPSVQAILSCVAALLAMGDEHTLRTMVVLAGKLSAASMFEMGMTRGDAMRMTDREPLG